MSYSIWGRIKARTENQGGAGWRESMPKNRRGCQNPTKLVKRPYKKSVGAFVTVFFALNESTQARGSRVTKKGAKPQGRG
jgi:hypothetical protein